MTDQPPAPQTVLFARGVIARLAVWSTLRIAIQESWGGPDAKQKSTWIASTIVDSFQDAVESRAELPDEQYVEEMLLQIMEDEFEAVLEDDSATSVARDVVQTWTETREGKDDTVRRFEELAEKIKGKRIDVKENVVSEGEEDWEDEDEDFVEDHDDVPRLLDHQVTPSSRNGPEVDEDGFTLVKGKGKDRE